MTPPISDFPTYRNRFAKGSEVRVVGDSSPYKGQKGVMIGASSSGLTAIVEVDGDMISVPMWELALESALRK